MSDSPSHLYQHLRAVAEELACAHRVSSAYGNSTGKGDMREAAFHEWLKEFLPATLAVSKGEIIDSTGRRSREFDCIIHLPSCVPRIFGRAGRRIVPVEEVLLVLEVKSTLRAEDVRVFSDSLAALGEFERFFNPSEVFKGFAAAAGGDVQPFCVPAARREQGIAAIHGAIFAYEAPVRSVRSWLEATPTHPSSPAAVHVLQSEFWLQQLPSQWRGTQSGPDAFPAFASFLLMATRDDKDRWAFLRPQVQRYVDSIMREIEQKSGVDTSAV